MRRAAPFLAAAAMLLPVVAAHADPYALNNLGNFAIYGFGSGFTNLDSPGPITINGNVGIGAGGDMTLHGSGQTITGAIYFADPVVNGVNFNADGTNLINGQAACNSAATCNTASRVFSNSVIAQDAKTDEIVMYAQIKGLAPTETNAGISSDFIRNTTNGVENITVVNVNGNIGLSSGDDIILTGDASDFFIFNVTGGMTGSSGGTIQLNGISPDHVVFNFLCTAAHAGVCANDGGTAGADISFSGSFTGAGIVFALDRNITEDTPSGGWTGRYLSDTDKTIKLFSEANITAPLPPTSAPEPGTFVLLATGFAGLGVIARNRKNTKA